MVAPAVMAAYIGGASLLGSTAMSTFGGGGGTQSGLHEDDWVLWDKNYKLQKEFAKNGIRWRVEDGRRAGLSPIASIGGNGAQGIPSIIGSTHQFKEGKGQKAAKMLKAGGQALSRVVAQSHDKVDLDIKKEQLRGLEFRNLALEREINKSTQPSLSHTDGTLGVDLPPDEVLLRENPQRYKADSIGVQRGGVHGKQAMFDEHGNLDFGLNQLTSEAYESDPVNQIKMVKRQLARYGSLAYGKAIDTPDGVVPFKTFVRQQSKFLNTKYKYAGYKIGYDSGERGFRLVKASRIMPSGFIRQKARSYPNPLKGNYGNFGKWFRETYKKVHK